MSTLLYQMGSSQPVLQEEDQARPGPEYVNHDAPPAEATGEPEWNTTEVDVSPELRGLTQRQVSGDVTDSQQFRPWWARFADEMHDVIVNRQVASSGTAAARESAGIQGHGTMEYTNSIAPVIRPGISFGNDYFTALPKPVQEGMGEDMLPVSNDSWMRAVAQSRGIEGQRRAERSTLYANFFRGY